MAHYSCYLIVSPNPRAFNGIGVNNNPLNNRFFIKFGDGPFRNSYSVDNPSFDSNENKLSTQGTREIVDNANRKRNVQIGKYLEWHYLKLGLSSERTEWHTIQLKNPTQAHMDELRRRLHDMIQTFPRYDWVGAHQDAFELHVDWLQANCNFG